MKTTRWQQRFENFERAFKLLKSVFEERAPSSLSKLEKEGVVQRFEFTFELAWKSLKDYLEYTGVTLEQVTPRAVIKQAFAAKIISEGQAWINMLEHRNKMSHVYDEKVFEETIKAIAEKYTTIIERLYLFLKAKDQEQ